MSARTLPQPVSPYGIPLTGEFLIHVLQDASVFDPAHFSYETVDEEEGIGVITGLKRGAAARSPLALLFMREKGWTKERVDGWFGINPKHLSEGKNPLLSLMRARQQLKIKGAITPIAGMVVRTTPLKKPPLPTKNLLPNPNAPNAPNILKGDTLWMADGTALDKAAFDAMIGRRDKC